MTALLKADLLFKVHINGLKQSKTQQWSCEGRHAVLETQLHVLYSITHSLQSYDLYILIKEKSLEKKYNLTFFMFNEKVNSCLCKCVTTQIVPIFSLALPSRFGA